ncbi:hypothetical protein FI667_g4649, partial [Globisporangium splendens]
MLRHTARVALRNGKLARARRSSAHLQAHVQTQRRAMGFFSDLKNQFKNELEKNEELKKSLDEFQKTKEQLKEVEKAAKEKYQEMSSKTEEAAKSFQEQATNASQKLKETLEENAKAASGAEKSNDKKDNQSDTTSESGSASASDESSSGKAEATEATDSPFDGARTFAKNIFAGFTTQRNKIIKPNALPKWRDEWKDAARELFGTKEKRSIDDALSSVKTPTHSKPASTESTDEAPEYTGSSALVAVKEDETAWQRVSARFREAPIIQGILDAAKQAARTEAGRKVGEKAKLAKDKIGDAREDVLEFWETSQNPWVYRMSSIYDGLFGETPMAVAIKEIRRAEPDFILEEWKENIEEIVLPGVLEAFLRGNSRDLKKWFGEAAYSRINIAIRERKTEGAAEDKQAPIILLRFQAQQINCIRNREGEVVDGAEDEVLAYYYIFAFQRDYDEEQEALRWRIVDIHMQRGVRASSSEPTPSFPHSPPQETAPEENHGVDQKAIGASQHAEPAIIENSDDEEEEELRSYEPIDMLQDAGINATDIAKLKEDGFATIGQLFQVSQKKLLSVKGISEAKVDKLLPEKMGFVSASALYLKTKSKTFITTGAKQLDSILGGGLETMSVTELCVTAQLPRSQGGGAGKVAFVDTEGTFRPNRVAEIAKERYNLNPSDVLDNIIVARAHSHDTQMDLIVKLGVLFADPEQGPFKLLIIDSVTALFRTDFSGRGELSDRQQRLNQHLIRLVKHAEEFNIAVLVVNQVMADPGANAMFGPVLKPVGECN